MPRHQPYCSRAGLGWAMGAGLALALFAAPAAGRDYAIAVAVTQSRSVQSPGLPVGWAAEPDRAATATLELVRPLLAGPRGEHAQYATGQALALPTREAIQKELQRLADEAAEGDRLAVYLATAAVRDAAGQAYLVLDDTAMGPSGPEAHRRVEKALSLPDFAAQVRKIAGPKVVVFLDLCALDGVIGQAELQHAFGPLGEGRAVLAWSAPREAYWEPGERITRLAGTLADGLRGAADADTDGHLRHAELIAYLEKQSRTAAAADCGPSLAVLNPDAAWEYPLQAAPFEALALRLAKAITARVQAEGYAQQSIGLQEPVGAAGSPWLTPQAKILARRVAAALAAQGLAATTQDKPDAAVAVSGRLEIRGQPDRLVVELELRAGDQHLGTVRDTALATGDVADLVLPTAQCVATRSRSAAALRGVRSASVEGTDTPDPDTPPARHPHFTAYEGLPASFRFELTDAQGHHATAIRPVEVGSQCYLPVEKGRCLRILVKRQSPDPCAVLVLVDGGNVMTTAGLSEDARFAAPEEHLARLHYFVLDEPREYAIEHWTTLGTERKAGAVEARRFVVADGPDALGYRHPGAELGEIRILLYAARKTSPQERAASASGIGIGAGPDERLRMSFVQWRADDSLPHARLVYHYRQAEDIPRASP